VEKSDVFASFLCMVEFLPFCFANSRQSSDLRRTLHFLGQPKVHCMFMALVQSPALQLVTVAWMGPGLVQ